MPFLPPARNNRKTTTARPNAHKRLTTAAVAALIVTACASPNGNTRPGTMDFALQKAAKESTANQDHVAAATYWGALYEKDPENAEVAANYGRSLRYIGSLPQAISTLHRAYLENTDHPLVLAEYGKVLVSAGHSDEALEMLERATSIGEPDWSLWMAKGIALDNMGRHDQAQVAHKTALELSPGNPKILNNLGLSLALNRHLDAAEVMLRDAVSTPGATARMRQNLSLVLGLQGNFIEAERLARVDLAPNLVSKNMAYLKTLYATSNQWGALSALGNSAPKNIDIPKLAKMPARDDEETEQIATPIIAPLPQDQSIATAPSTPEAIQAASSDGIGDPSNEEMATAPMMPVPQIEQNLLTELPENPQPNDVDQAMPELEDTSALEDTSELKNAEQPIATPDDIEAVDLAPAAGQKTELPIAKSEEETIAIDADNPKIEPEKTADITSETDDLNDAQSEQDDIAEINIGSGTSTGSGTEAETDINTTSDAEPEAKDTEDTANNEITNSEPIIGERQVPALTKNTDWVLRKNIPEISNALPGKPIPALQLLRRDSAIANKGSEAPTRIVPEDFYKDPS